MKGRKIQRLPEEVRQYLYEMLEARKLTSQEISDQINDMLAEYPGETDVDSVSKNAVWREAQRMDEISNQMRESQHWADRMSEKFDLSNLGEQGKLLLSMLSTAAFKTSAHLMNKDDPIDPETLGDLVLSISRLQRGANYSAELEKQIAEKVRKETLEAAANAVENTAKKGGSNKETIQLLRQAISDIRL
jgi:hypothetical protein